MTRIGCTALILGALTVLCQPAWSQSHLYLDFNGTEPGSGVHPGGTWFMWSETAVGTEFWSTSAQGTGQPQLWVNGRIAVIAAGSDCSGWGPEGGLVSGFGVPVVGGVRVEDCPFRISDSVLKLTGSDPALFQAADQSLTIASQLEWPWGATIRKTGAGNLIFDAASGDGGSPGSSSFLIEQGRAEFKSSSNNWFGGTSSASITVGTVSNSAILQLAAPHQMRNHTVLDLVNGSFQMAGHDETLGGLTGTGTVSGGGALLTLQPLGEDHVFAGAMGSDATRLTVSGSGSQTLQQVQMHSGLTRIENGGYLIAAGLPNSPLELIHGRLDITGTINDVTVDANGQLRLGAPVGDVYGTQLQWNGEGELIWQLGPTGTSGDSSRLVLSSALTHDGAGPMRVLLDPGSSLPVTAQAYTLIEFASTDAEIADFVVIDPGVLGDRDYELQLNATSLVLQLDALDGVFDDRFESDP